MLYLYTLVAYLLISIGISCIWSLSEIFMKPRNFVAKYFPKFLRKLLLCMECSSFWIGIFTSIIIFPIYIPIETFPAINHICGGIITHLFVKILNNYNVFEGKKL